MKHLRELVEACHGAVGDLSISGVTVDSRHVTKGTLFVALKGIHQDGHLHAAEAVRAGAVAIVAEHPLGVDVPVLLVPSSSDALSGIAARYYDFPSRNLAVVGITGTNGKTTITYLLENIWREDKTVGGVMGTIDYRWLDHVEKAPNTTPHALEVQRLLSAMGAAGVQRVAMEVSSHALSLRRVEDVTFSVGVFTNLTQDHLDFHKNMEGYFQAKAHLFELLEQSSSPVRRAILNRDDPWGRRLMEKINLSTWTYGIAGDADFRAEGLALSAHGSRFRAVTPMGKRDIHLALVGRHNVYNALAALGASVSLGTTLETAAVGLESLTGVPGRLERVTEHPAGSLEKSKHRFSVFVDYAHTDDALRNVLETLRPLAKGRIIVLFGCGGDRDKTKRPRMGEMAARLADHVVVTSDNPRSEDPIAIAHEVESGVLRVPGRTYEMIVDRGAAVQRAIEIAKEGDVVLLAGKGHETYQIFKEGSVDFDDRAEARRLLRDLR